MQSRKKKCYVKVLKALKRLQPKFKPTSVMADFEKSQQKGWAKVFPNSKRRGCHFHFTKVCVFVLLGASMSYHCKWSHVHFFFFSEHY